MSLVENKAAQSWSSQNGGKSFCDFIRKKCCRFFSASSGNEKYSTEICQKGAKKQTKTKKKSQKGCFSRK